MGLRSPAASKPAVARVTGRRGTVLSADASSFALIDRALKEFQPALRTEMRREIKNLMAPSIAAAKRNVLAPPYSTLTSRRSRKGRGRKRSTGLRANLARGIILEQSAGLRSNRVGVFIRSRSKFLPEDQKNLTRKYGARRGRWRHPVPMPKGREPVWVAQVGRPRYLVEATDPYAAKAEEAVREAVKNAARRAGLID